jgi:integrase
MSLKIVRRGKSPNWYIRGTVRGIVVDESTGTDKKTAAEAIRIRREAEILDRSVFGTRATATWLEAAVAYMEGGGEARFIAPLNEYFGTAPISQIDQQAVDRAARVIYPDGGPATLARQVYGKISAVLKFAADRKMCDHWQVKRPKQPSGRIRWIEPDEAERLIEACSFHLRPLVTFMLYTGARVSEALYLDWANVDLSRSHVYFPETKNGEARGVPLHSRVVAILANSNHREGAVFRTHIGRSYEIKRASGGQIKTAFNGACRRAGISDFTPHDCRHTWATWHYRANRDLIQLKELGGWKTERMVLRYAHVNKSNLAKSIEALPWGISGEHDCTRKENGERTAC